MNYHNIIHCDTRDGADVGVVLFVSGCNHNCPGCHNPQTHDPCSGIFFDDKAKQEIMEELSKDWCHRLTLSGGDPLFPNNRKDILDLITEVKNRFPDKKIWMYTGYVYEEIKDVPDISPILNKVDVLIDGPFIQSKKEYGLKWRGSSNQRVIDLRTGNLLYN